MSSDPRAQSKHSRRTSLSLQTNGAGQNDPSSAGAAPKPQKQMTKAERRELQERQRAAKAANKAAAPGAQIDGPAAKPQHSTAPASSHPKKSGRGGESPVQTRGPLVAGSSGPPNKSAKESKATAEEAAERSRGLRIFSHFALQKPPGHVAKGNAHPAIVRLGLMFAEFKICGANARCIATLSVFKRVIQDYTTPPNNTLSRHLMTHLSVQISHLVSARPMSVTMGNAIRQLKLEISDSDIDLPEQDVRSCLALYNFRSPDSHSFGSTGEGCALWQNRQLHPRSDYHC